MAETDLAIHTLGPFHPIDLILRKRGALSRRRAPEIPGRSFETPLTAAPQDEVVEVEMKMWIPGSSPGMTVVLN
jgi:hypothetical protein